MIDYILVNIKEYVCEGLRNGFLIPKEAKKNARIFARQGIPGEKVITYSTNGLIETTNTVQLDLETNQPGWIATKVENGVVLLDEFGNRNEWIIPDSVFKKKYEIDSENPYLFRPKGGIQLFVEIPHNIKFNALWGEEMNICAGGYLNITDIDNIYGLQERDFLETYRFLNDEKSKKMKRGSL